MYNFKGFTAKANEALNLAITSAEEMGHTYIGSEHIILGLLKEGSGVAATELAKRMADYGVATIIFTDISRDGMLSGVNAEATAALARACGVPIIASGGVASLDDIRNVKKYEKDGVAGCIIGKAIYTGAVNLPDALKIAAAKEE